MIILNNNNYKWYPFSNGMKKSLKNIVWCLGFLGSFGIGSVGGWYGKELYEYKQIIDAVAKEDTKPFMYASYTPTKRKLEEGLTLFSDDSQEDLSRILKGSTINPRGDDGYRYKVQIDPSGKMDIMP